jgi:carboxyl-terminal processing protease
MGTIRWCWVLAGLVLVGGCAHSPARRPITSAIALESFDAAHRLVAESHFDTTFNGVDWMAWGSELRPRAARARTMDELRRVIRDLIQRLGQSHFAVIPHEAADALDPTDTTAAARAGDVGMDVRLVDGEVLVTEVWPGGPAERAGIRPGWVVRRVESKAVGKIVGTARRNPGVLSVPMRVWARLTALMTGEAGSECDLELLDATDRRVRVELTRERSRGQAVRFGNQPAFFARLEDRTLEAPPNGPAIGLVRFNIWMVPLVARFDAAIDRFRGLDGIVIDLRGNRGGVGGMVPGVAGHFFTDERLLGTFRTRELDLMVKAAPREVDGEGRAVVPYGGPVAILTDCITGSASEVFAAGLQSVGRARVFGDTTAGGVLPARMDRLPDRDVLLHAYAEFVTAKGDRLEGRGIVPDETVELRRADLLAGRDPTLEAARRWIEARPRATRHHVRNEEVSR